MPAASREVIITEPLALIVGEPLQLKKKYPPQARALLQGIRLNTLILEDSFSGQREIVVPTNMRNFTRAKEHHQFPGMERKLPEDVHVRYLVVDLIHDPDAYDAWVPTGNGTSASLGYALRIRLRYDADADLLEGGISPWTAPVPVGQTSVTPPEWTYLASFQLTYHIPY